MNVVLTQRAKNDLSGIQRFIGQDNPKRAENFVEELLDACYGLSTMPLAFPLVPRYERQGVRRRSHNAYLIFYRVESSLIEVVHITHNARDYEPLLFSDGL